MGLNVQSFVCLVGLAKPERLDLIILTLILFHYTAQKWTSPQPVFSGRS